MKMHFLPCALVFQIGTLQQITVTFRPEFDDMVDAIDSSSFAALGNLHLLTSLDIKLAGTIR